jgi:hypothetical protein
LKQVHSVTVAVQMKPEYGPTLGRLLAPRWHAASRLARTAVIAAGMVALLAIVAAALTLENARFSHGGRVPFSFSYRDLYRTAPDPGGYVKVQSRWPDGALKYSYAVDPLLLPAYPGELTAELPLFVTGLLPSFARRYPDFELRGEGKTKVNNTLTGYQIMFTARAEGEQVYGRVVLLLPPRERAREGVMVVMLTSSTATTQITSPLEVGTTGVLLKPIKTFAFG